MNKVTLFALFIISSFTAAQAEQDLATVSYVDIDKYMGDWYEIAKLPNRFQKNCLGSKANYKLKENGSVLITNKCVTKETGKIKTAKGVGFVADNDTNSKLKISFVPFFKYFGWFSGDYYIMKLDSNYKYVLVGTPSKEFLWILSRENTLEQNIVESLLDYAKKEGFDTSRVEMSPVFNK